MSRKCMEVELLLSACLEGGLPGEEALVVAGHIETCSECRMKKERMEAVIARLPDLEEEVPLFLNSRLCRIPDMVVYKEPVRFWVFPKWVAAAVGTVILFLNLFYFTDLFPSANRRMHAAVSTVEKFAVKTGGWFERVKESKELVFFTLFSKKTGETKTDNWNQASSVKNGGKNG